MTCEDSFEFLDLDDVIQGSHVIPCMKEGVARRDKTCLSHCAQDHADWKLYYINWYVSLFGGSCFKSYSRQALLTGT